MGLDIFFECPSCKRNCARDVYITYNYSGIYAELVEAGVFDSSDIGRDAWFGEEKGSMLGFIDGKRAEEVVPMVRRGIEALDDIDRGKPDGWAATKGNARYGLERLLRSCLEAPNSVIRTSR